MATSSEAKLDLIINQLKVLGPLQTSLEDLKNSIGPVKEDMRNLQYDMADHHNRLAVLKREMQEQKDASNQQQQLLRALTLRLLNFPAVIGESKDNNAGLCARVYNMILKPLLVAAEAAKDLSSVPQAATVIEACFRPFNAAANSEGPPQVIIKISSKPLKVAILKQRKKVIIGSVYHPGKAPGLTFSQQFEQFSEILSIVLAELSRDYEHVVKDASRLIYFMLNSWRIFCKTYSRIYCTN